MSMDRELSQHIQAIELNQKTIHAEVVAVRNDLLKTYRDLDQAFDRVFKRLADLEREVKKRS